MSTMSNATVEDALGIEPYDFRQPHRLPKDQQRTVESINTRVAARLTDWLNLRMRGAIDVGLRSVRIVPPALFTQSLPDPCATFVLDVATNDGCAAIDLDPALAFYFVDRLMGGAGEPTVPERALTALEGDVLAIIARSALSELTAAWRHITDLDLSIRRFESDRELVASVAPDRALLSAEFEVTSGDTSYGSLRACLPGSLTERLSSKAPARASSAGGQRPRERRLAETVIRNAHVDLSAWIVGPDIALGEIVKLTPGATLGPGLPARPQVQLHIDGIARFTGTAEYQDHSITVRIERVHRTGEDMSEKPSSSKKPETGNPETVTQDAAGNPQVDPKLAALFGVSLPVTIQLGRSRVSVQDVLELGHGSVIQIDRQVGEPVDVMIGGKPFAQGEVVVMGEQLGVRITQIIEAVEPTPAESEHTTVDAA